MVRILSCHHFRGQRIGRCDEAVGVAVAGDTVIVALEHQINVYAKARNQPHSHGLNLDAAVEVHGSPPPPLPGPSSSGATTTAKLMEAAAVAAANHGKSKPSPALHQGSTHLGNHDLGSSFVFLRSGTGTTGSGSAPSTPVPGRNNKDKNKEAGSVSSGVESDMDLRLSHTFPTIDLIHRISYNEKGKYILCLEKRESSSNSMTNVRSYFHWDKDHGTKPMRARIAGLVSPTGAEPEEDSLMMVEIQLTSPATAVVSCNLTGHIAALSAESIVNIFLFRAKEVTTRIKVHYYDFDRTYALEMPGFIPDQIYFVSNYLACMNLEKVHVFRVAKEEGNDGSSPGNISETGRHLNKDSNDKEKVVFNSKSETIKVYLPSIIRANRKRKATSVNISEYYQDEITSNHTKVVFSAISPGICVEDVLRLGISNASGNHQKILELGLYPIRIKDRLGAVALMVCTQKEGYLYHLPSKANCSVLRVASYPFTAPIISFAFDSIFFHALTDTGLESYSCRSLYYAIKDQEGIKPFLNDCPLLEEPPTLVGIRPFVGVRKMACNNLILCMLASSNSTNNKTTTPQEEPAWTIYTLENPEIEMIVDDILKMANLQADTTSESYITLLCEGYIALKLFTDGHPGSEASLLSRQKDICKLLGLAYLKLSVSVLNSGSRSGTPVEATTASPSAISSAPDSSSASEVLSTVSLDITDDLVDKGVTYLMIGRCGVQEVLSPENWSTIREPHYIPGVIRLIEVTFIKCNEYEINPDNQKLSPTLAPILVEFLANSGPQILVDLVIVAPFIRECNSRRLLTILQQLAEARNYPPRETLAVLLTLVTIGGTDLSTRSQVKDLLHKTNINDLEILLTKEKLLETRGQQHTFLTDLAVCIVASEDQHLVAEKLFQYLRANDIGMSIVMFAFAQAMNVNNDSVLQHCITKCLIQIVEKFISDKLKKMAELTHLEFVEEEKRSVQLLVRTYLSNINFSSNIPTPTTAVATNEPSAALHVIPKSTEIVPSAPTDNVKRTPIFGSICTCVNYLLSINCPGGMLTPQCQNVATVHLFVNEDSRENYIKLLSLLSNPVLSNMEGIKDIILTYLYKTATQVKPAVNSTLFSILQILAETPDKSVDTLLTRQPTTIMLFAKETFGKVPSKWKSLVTNLKKRVQNSGSNSTAETEIFATILESVYLHLANSLTPHELEQVLDKETGESHKFHGICKRVELANNYANMVITVSSDYLNHK